MNTLDIDPAALAAEADAAVGLQGASFAGSPGEPAPVAPGESWAPVVAGMMGLADIVAPNWELQAEEKTAFGDALTPILDQLFPGGFGNEKWAPYLRLVAVSAGIVLVRLENGQLRPLRRPPPPPPEKKASINDP